MSGIVVMTRDVCELPKWLEPYAVDLPGLRWVFVTFWENGTAEHLSGRIVAQTELDTVVHLEVERFDRGGGVYRVAVSYEEILEIDEAGEIRSSS